MSKNKAVRAVVGIICAIIIVLGVAFSISYHVWTARGDKVTFSPMADLGLGNDPIIETNDRGQRIQIGINHNFLFVRDMYIDRSTFTKFTSGGTPPGGQPAAH